MSDDLISRKVLIEEIRSLRCSITGLRAGTGVLTCYEDEYRKSILKIIDDQPMAIETKEIFENSPFGLINRAFKNLYPEKEYKACIEPDITDDQGEKAYGITIFYEDETPIVAISAELAIKDAAEVFAHELAHVAAGEGAGHGKEWEEAFDKICREYQRIGEEMFKEEGDGK